MTELKKQIETWEETAVSALKSIDSIASLELFYTQYLGKKGSLKDLRNQLKSLSIEEKKEIGATIHRAQNLVTEQFEALQETLKKKALDEKLASEHIDPTQNTPHKYGSIHPLSQVQKEVENIFSGMGYTIADGPEIETEWHNFDALNVPDNHPARDMQDTFWISKETEDSHKNYVLRTQTSNAQIRMMKQFGAPLRMICPGRVFRSEATDATHDSVFYQVEGLVVDKGITLGHLKGTIETMLSEIFKKDVKVRFRPGFFPFVEPGLEVDMWWEYTDKNGKSCGKWLEFMGAGMVHPNVLKACDIDPNEWGGFAFGFGLTRLVMMRYGIEDIRHLFGTKPRFLSQF